MRSGIILNAPAGAPPAGATWHWDSTGNIRGAGGRIIVLTDGADQPLGMVAPRPAT